MDNVYIDFLLVEKLDDSQVFVTIESCKAVVGGIVEFDNGELGHVKMKAWGGEADSEVFKLISALIPTYEAEAYYSQRWKKTEDTNAVS